MIFNNRIPQFRNRKHWTPKYIKNRLALMLTDLLHPDWPMLTKDAILWLDKRLTKSMVGIEFGGGRSTLWLAKRLFWLYSVEHDPLWVREAENVANIVTGNFVLYALDYSANALDFALIDGEQRDACALTMVDRLKSGGILVVDDIERYNSSVSIVWACFFASVSEWRYIHTTNGIRDTAIWIKP